MWVKHNGTIIRNPHRPIIEDLDLIPFPDYNFENHYIWEKDTGKIIPFTLDSFKKYNLPEKTPGSVQYLKYLTLFSRGCPFSCTYCYSFKEMYKGQKYVRFRSTENMMQELEFIKKKLPFIQIVCFVDDNIYTLSMEKINEFCSNYKKRIGLPMLFTGHPKDINEEKLSRFIDAGLIITCMGVQSGSQRTKKLYKRNVSDATILNAVHAFHKFKDSLVAIYYDVIIDNPYETNEDFVDTIRLLLKFPKPRCIRLFSLTFFPGTELYEKATQDGILPKEDELREYRKNLLNFQHRKKNYLNFVFPL